MIKKEERESYEQSKEITKQEKEKKKNKRKQKIRKQIGRKGKHKNIEITVTGEANITQGLWPSTSS